MASFYKRGPGQWEARIQRIGFPFQCRTWNTKAKAQEWARKVEADMDAGVFVAVKETRKMPLHDLIERYRKEIAPRLADQKEKNRILDEIDAKFGTYAVFNLAPKIIAAWRDELAKTGLKGARSGSTVNHYLNTLSAVYTAAMKEFHLPIPFN